jgi:c-di-GMP-related signal transduction protein
MTSRRDFPAPQNSPANGPADASHKLTSELRYIARQPILNLKGEVHGYELLFRDAPDAASDPDRDLAARTMLDNAVLFGLERFTNGAPVLVNCTAEALSSELMNVLTPGRSILAIPASLEPSSELTSEFVQACRELKGRGFRLALDDFTSKVKLQPVLEIADYIRVDFTRLNAAERQHLRRIDGTIDEARIAKLAKKVDTQEDYRRACEDGFTLFQGDYICHPVLLKKRKIPTNRQFHLEILQELVHDPIDITRVSNLVMRDAALTFRLLRLVNSPIFAIRHEVRSVEAAIFLVGDDNLRRLVTLGLLSELNATHVKEILHMALLRARFCEQAAALFALNPGEQYLLGLLSLAPAMLDLPMEELLPSLPLRKGICEALLRTMNPERGPLSWLELHERGDWDACDEIIEANLARRQLLRYDDLDRQHQSQRELNDAYADAVVWAGAALSECLIRT